MITFFQLRFLAIILVIFSHAVLFFNRVHSSLYLYTCECVYVSILIIYCISVVWFFFHVFATHTHMPSDWKMDESHAF